MKTIGPDCIIKTEQYHSIDSLRHVIRITQTNQGQYFSVSLDTVKHYMWLTTRSITGVYSPHELPAWFDMA